MTEAADTMSAALRLLHGKGLRYSTVFDIGCADGHFFLQHYSQGEFEGATCVNIDANPIYEPSLHAIRDVLGGHYLIAAVSDREGETEMATSVHPYWGSLRPDGDVYWEQINRLSGGKVRVRTVTLDGVVKALALKPPFLIKLDVQGSEASALSGAREMLKQTDVVICETGPEDFRGVDRLMEEAGLSLFDLTEWRRIADQSLGWFYPVYLSRRLDHVRRRSFWDARFNEVVVNMQKERRQHVLAYTRDMLEKIKLKQK
jgi:FkbM family methyltransferase